MLVELGKRLCGRGIFQNSDDIFFLRLEELEPVIQGKANFDVKEVIRSRRDEYEKNKSDNSEDLLHGPQNRDDAHSQADIDAILASLE